MQEKVGKNLLNINTQMRILSLFQTPMLVPKRSKPFVAQVLEAR